VIYLGVLHINLLEEGNVKMVGSLLAVGCASEDEAGRLEIELEGLWGYIGDGDGQKDVVLLGVGGG
jgi:hypothetical protein